MAYEIIIGRKEGDRKEFGTKGTILIGKHYVKMGQISSLSNQVLLDVIRSHVIFVCGKRGSGKSYTMGVIAEGMADLPKEISQNLAIVIFDTMGVYWTMKYANKKDAKLLDEWDLEERPFNVQIYTPIGYFKKYKNEGIPTDFPFSIKPSELSVQDWCLTFDITITDPLGVLIERTIEKLKKERTNFSIDDIIKAVREDKKTEENIKNAAENRFTATKNWGLFSTKGTKIDELVSGGQVTIIDLSCYAMTEGAEGLRALVIGLLSQKLFIKRMVEKRKEEFQSIRKEIHYLTEEEKEKQEYPLVWLIVDEAHEFIPLQGKTTATNSLITILREGRQPGISLILASQQPGKIHTDVMSQSDIVIAHELTSKIDIEALKALMQSYMRESLDKQLNELPKVKGAGIIFDDVNEKSYPIRVRPRFTWHGGEAPTALHKKKKLFDF